MCIKCFTFILSFNINRIINSLNYKKLEETANEKCKIKCIWILDTRSTIWFNQIYVCTYETRNTQRFPTGVSNFSRRENLLALWQLSCGTFKFIMTRSKGDTIFYMQCVYRVCESTKGKTRFLTRQKRLDERRN